MSNGTQDVLDRIFASLSGNGMGNSGGGLGGLVTGALGGDTPAASATHSGGSTAAAIGMDILKSGFGLVPLVGSLLGLFGGGGQDAPAPLVKYAMPASIQFQGAETASGIAEADHDQRGMARAVAGSQGGPAGQPYISVNVQAMDARSFLDRSSDIAAAVREAMLNLNSINDV